MADPFGGVQAAEMMGGMFGPNQYSQFPGRIPQPGYVGMPTDAMGNPIQAAPGMTLNSAPSAAAAAAAAPSTAGPTYYAGTPGNPNYRTSQTYDPSQFLAGAPGVSSAQSRQNEQARWNQIQGLGPGGAQGLPADGSTAPSPSSTPGAGSLDNALSLLSNPGKVTTQGATVPQSQIGGGPSVLQSFLASRQGGTGAGNYSNQPFFETLNRLRGQ